MVTPKPPSTEQDTDLHRSADTDALSEKVVVLGLPGAPISRVDREREAEALVCVRNHQRDVALKILMVVYGDLLAGFIARLVPARTKDIYQEVFLRAFRGIHKFRHGKHASMWAWLCQITYQRFLEEDRHPDFDGPIVASEENSWLDAHDVLIGGRAAPRNEMDDRAQRVERCLAEMPAPQRAQLLMRFALGLSDAEIGMAVGIDSGTVGQNATLPGTAMNGSM
jgi:RNA polymerase sigma factor (sigma-70 family)